MTVFEPEALPNRPKLAVDAAARSSFGAPFWCTYAANFSMTVANSLLFRYADFVKLHDGDNFEYKLGWIVGVGMVGSLAMRVAQGVGIDKYGPRLVWLVSSVLFAAGCFGHIAVDSISGPTVYALRIMLQTGLAGFFGASITFISGRASVARMADAIGTLGTSGFIGMVVGSLLGDWLYTSAADATQGVSQATVNQMFFLAGSLGACGLAFAWLATMGHPPPAQREPVLLRGVLRQYHPGAPLLLVGAAIGFGLALPGVFLRPYAASLGIAQMRVFWGVYAPLAFVARLAIRGFPERYGVRPMIHIGMTFLAAAMLSMLAVHAEWHFVLPAVLIGIAHAFLFPAVVAGSTGAFPVAYRGLGTTLILSMFDLGSVLGSPTVGAILTGARYLDWQPYTVMFLTVACALSAIGIYYSLAPKDAKSAS